MRLDPTSASDVVGRGVCLLLGAALAFAALARLHESSRDAGTIGVDAQSQPQPAHFQQTRLNAWEIGDYAGVYRPEQADPAKVEAIWLGNPQLHTINQPTPGDALAPQHASEALGYRVYGLSLNNANLQEQLVVLHWSLARRDSDWLILAVCYDDLREDGLRDELVDLVTPPTEPGPPGPPGAGERLADEIAAAERGRSKVQGAGHSGLCGRTSRRTNSSRCSKRTGPCGPVAPTCSRPSGTDSTNYATQRSGSRRRASGG